MKLFLRTPQIFSWLARPQLVIGFAVLCLGMSAAGAWERQVNTSVMPFLKPHTLPEQELRTQNTPSLCVPMPCIALTFDDGPNEQITPQILDLLAKYQVRATFFVVGSHVVGHEPILKRIHNDRHEIGNHSWSHPDFSTLSPEDMELQLSRTQRAITEAGVPAPKILRPPYGVVNEMVAAHNHLSIVRWNVDPEDWKEKNPAKVAQRIIQAARPGAIILLHDTHSSSVGAIDQAVPVLKQQYQLVTVSQLLNLSPGDQGQFFGH